MRMFVLQPKKPKIPIMEVKCEMVTALDDPSVMWLKSGEYKAKIILPIIFHQPVEKIIDDKKVIVMVPEAWHSHSLFKTLEEALHKREFLIRYEFEFALNKYGTSFSEEDITEKLLEVEVVTLKNT